MKIGKTTMEIVDVVNEQNKIIGKISKEKAHQKEFLHRCIIAEIIDSKGKWTLVKQASDRQDAGKFVSPVGGHIRTGESAFDALSREALEETGVTHFSSRFIGQGIFNREIIGRKENHFFILYEIYTDEKLSINHESVATEQFSRQGLHKQLKNNPEKFGDAFKFILKKFYPELY